jgi:hypothetical protein
MVELWEPSKLDYLIIISSVVFSDIIMAQLSGFR